MDGQLVVWNTRFEAFIGKWNFYTVAWRRRKVSLSSLDK